MAYTESDTRSKLIDPLIKESEWLESNIVREYYFTDGRKLIGGKRGKRYFVDYLLTYKNTNLAIIEAKAESKDPLDGLQQSINYAERLRIDYVYSTNGHKIYEHSLKDGKGKFIDNYPTPYELFLRKYGEQTSKAQDVITHPFHIEGTMKPRFYQQIAVQKTIEAIAENKDRILLTLATGTGKTYIAFQIAYRLFQSKWNRDGSDRRPKILFLADRNVLKDQSMNTFNPLEKDCVEINGKIIKKRGGKVPTAGNIFFAIYQSIAENKNRVIETSEEEQEDDVTAYYKQYPSNFFDLIIIDECHRGSANDESSWRDILNHFTSAVHLGLTATPKRDDNGDTYKYFGDPIYEYSLKDGINDGFLTPYKVKRIQTNIDEYRFDPNDIITGELDKQIVVLEQFEKQVVIPKRTELIAKTILQNMNPMDKSIIFCVNQKHAMDMKVAIDKFKTIKDNNYCVRVTSDEGDIGREFLEMFQNNDRDIPTILTSSKMLTTGVDAKNVRNVVLTAPIKSMTEFKQIIGRGTRVFEGKDFFTIMDFVGATNLFYDPAWDGEDLPSNGGEEKQPKELKNKTDAADSDDTETGDEKPTNEKVTIDIKGKKLKVINIETTYVGMDGIPLKTEDYLELLIGVLGKFYNDENGLREIWSNPTNRKDLLNKLREMHIDESQLNDLKVIFEAENSDIYDVLAHISFNLNIKTRNERVIAVESSEFVEKFHNEKAKEFIEFILQRYQKDGVKELDEDKLGKLVDLSGLGTVREVAQNFGGIPQMREEYFELQREIYR
ncbi:MAG: DEAD/DEAH box helicase family protein [Epsilonproteobacteria bacterium]|nr:DEAD/DEAH box helicase family protein [Campylobacterota bacterium]OIO14985.1 MAG: DEAD/DEAH box helicase [Helicobacteraceae bacterium CG1_02_36_14]PIP10558.1 MAG: DEAD/DEAH box helicase [Sulfurimonas sp. CG23_combo_of_CG06-09_8_20_14_all_36_33]PIS27008.1 MAG: DEAD/DEAH box helicase [Sulfurimonas sp. CG08_land_8_20_14_0_20_36_33]PIU35902.1 MAG: DEAD/DEAH box helicase [Sulfurimonas sp. CG07_land_8_20_14_0_80_36_56]PIV03479.1 MAG: DEAD/DEAH box helicase [Sulfurimonas sp. CG03_land_8_20_14_0_80